MLPERLAGDTNYGSAAMLGWLVGEKNMEPHFPVWEKSVRTDGIFSNRDFLWNEEVDEYRCPAYKTLRCDRRKFKMPHTRITKANTIFYKASSPDCAACPMELNCYPNMPHRKIARSLHENA